MYYVYVIQCCDHTLYTGWTTDIAKRLRQHNAGNGARYTRGRRPVTLVYSEILTSRTAALQREYAIKQLSRADKLALVASSGIV